MNLLISMHNDPYLNLATEEFLLKNSVEDFIFLYVNRPCVVVGKHQITQKEINSNFIYENKILVARRLSGGGTVYHDEGNLNFSYIQSIAPGGSISYQQITQSIYGYLKNKIPTIELSERNDFMLQGKKISGSAMHVYKNRLIAHGTLLINCNLSNLSTSLKVDQQRFTDKSISSRKAGVINVSSVYNGLNINTLIKEFTQYLRALGPVNEYQLSQSASDTVHELARAKYSDKNWIFCYSPKYTYTNSFNFRKKLVQYQLEVVKGLIESVSIEQPDSISKSNYLNMCSMKGKLHNIFDLQNEFLDNDNYSFNIALLNSLF